MYSEQNKPRFDMQNNGVVNLPYRISPYFIYHPFFPFQNVILLYIIKGRLQCEICLADHLPGGIRGGWESDSRIPPRSLWLSASSSLLAFR